LTLAWSVGASPAPIPAERRLAQTQEGQAQLKQMHQALFTAGQAILKKQLKEIFGRKIYEMVATWSHFLERTRLRSGSGKRFAVHLDCSGPRQSVDFDPP